MIVLKDLRPRKSSLGDTIEEWELTLPFSMCTMGAYSYNLKLAHDDSGGKGFITLPALAKSFTTPAWTEIRKPNSHLVQFLLDNFGHKEKDCIDF